MTRKQFLITCLTVGISIFPIIEILKKLGEASASPLTVPVNVTNGTLGGGASIVKNSSAVNGEAVQFSQPSTPSSPSGSNKGKVYMGGYTDAGTVSAGKAWAAAQGVPAAGAFISIYQWGNGWSQVQSVQIQEAQQMGSYPGPRCLNAAMTQSQSESNLSSALSGNSLTSAALACHTASATACAQNGVQFIRWAWEFNAGNGYNWMPPFSSYTSTEFKTLWKLTYNAWNAAAVKAGKPNNWFKFVFCMNQADWNGVANMKNYYPGMPYASYITIDEYDRSQGNYTGWDEALNDPPGLANAVTLALAQGAEGVGLPEWGIRNDAYGPKVIPDPSYINSAFAWMKTVTAQGLNVLAWPWGAGFDGNINSINGGVGSWDFAAWPTMWSALRANVATGISEGWIATTNPTT